LSSLWRRIRSRALSMSADELGARVEDLEQKLLRARVDLEIERDLVAKLVTQVEGLIEAEISRRSHSSWWAEEIGSINRQ
jgi:hypothetical protein